MVSSGVEEGSDVALKNPALLCAARAKLCKPSGYYIKSPGFQEPFESSLMIRTVLTFCTDGLFLAMCEHSVDSKIKRLCLWLLWQYFSHHEFTEIISMQISKVCTEFR